MVSMTDRERIALIRGVQEQEAAGRPVSPVETRMPVGSLAVALVGLPAARRKQGPKDEVVSAAGAAVIDLAKERRGRSRVLDPFAGSGAFVFEPAAEKERVP